MFLYECFLHTTILICLCNSYVSLKKRSLFLIFYPFYAHYTWSAVSLYLRFLQEDLTLLSRSQGKRKHHWTLLQIFNKNKNQQNPLSWSKTSLLNKNEILSLDRNPLFYENEILSLERKQNPLYWSKSSLLIKILFLEQKQNPLSWSKSFLFNEILTLQQILTKISNEILTLQRWRVSSKPYSTVSWDAAETCFVQLAETLLKSSLHS